MKRNLAYIMMHNGNNRIVDSITILLSCVHFCNWRFFSCFIGIKEGGHLSNNIQCSCGVQR